MTGTVFIFLGVVIGINISSSNALRMCYNCVGAASATDCDKIIRCGSNEECFEEEVITGHYVLFNSGCRSKRLCQTGTGIPIGKRANVVVCSKCCDSDFCNVGLCGGATPRSLRCLSCNQLTVHLADCDRIKECDVDHMCFAHRTLNHADSTSRVETGCLGILQCQGIANAPFINQCFECCDTPMCNLYKCGNNWTAVMHLQTTKIPAQAHTTLPTTTIQPLLPPHISGQLTINLNADTILACNSNELGVTYTWLYQGSKSLPYGVSIIGGNHLAIIGANSSNVGTFTCVINKNDLQAVSMTNVTIIPEKAHVTSVLVSPNHPQIGHRVDIHCDATGYPDPSIYWSYTDTMGLSYMPISASYLDSTSVRINNFQPALHSGTWTCIARNSLGVDRQFIQL